MELAQKYWWAILLLVIVFLYYYNTKAPKEIKQNDMPPAQGSQNLKMMI
jgi:hypothetical protein